MLHAVAGGGIVAGASAVAEKARTDPVISDMFQSCAHTKLWMMMFRSPWMLPTRRSQYVEGVAVASGCGAGRREEKELISIRRFDWRFQASEASRPARAPRDLELAVMG